MEFNVDHLAFHGLEVLTFYLFKSIQIDIGRENATLSYTLYMLTDYVVELYDLFIFLKETEMTLSQATEYMLDCTVLSLYCILNSDIF